MSESREKSVSKSSRWRLQKSCLYIEFIVIENSSKSSRLKSCKRRESVIKWSNILTINASFQLYFPPFDALTRLFLSLQDYPKLSQSFYSLLEVLTQDHMNFIASLEPHVVMYILSSISEGLTALGKTLRGQVWVVRSVRVMCSCYICVCVSDTMVCTGCCSSLDHIVTYLFKQLSRSTKKRPTPMATDDRFLHIMQQHPEMIQQVRDQLTPLLSLLHRKGPTWPSQ